MSFACVLPPPLALRSRAAVASSLAAHPLPLVVAADRLRDPRLAETGRGVKARRGPQARDLCSPLRR